MLKPLPIIASLVMLAALAVYVVALPPKKLGTQHLDTCPMTIASMRGVDLDLSQTVLDDLQPDGILSRAYERPDGLPVWLIIVYFENARLGAHDPLLCYRSQGFELELLPDEVVQTGIGPVPTKAFRAVRGNRVERVNYFWYTAGAKALAEVRAFRDEMFLQGLKENRAFGAFVRISTVESDGAADAVRWNHTFLQDLAPWLPRFFPEND
ncbi:MAG: EpsI family protein [Candidatus Eisenbacteria bacterium]|uniref:EpsI family protein n=1 Tax=Eiseniibacteriota bacterium TaxID=2212470 RepID=A0A956SFK3_UNCEI|nr:EpsI family protein [Candidatus Eisenbacteria bacterium]MCB9462754.1 EpsI family protein [Candidatus Eisenbacteria bacterium]